MQQLPSLVASDGLFDVSVTGVITTFNGGFVGVDYCTVCQSRCSVTHLLGDLVRVEDARDGHLDLVFLFLGLSKRRLPLLQKQVGGVLAGKLLKRQQERTRR
ncbi:hypothetical protein EYF80_024340 [Liparis tanakae]|uniref:Uncharacterized protein n=1 Tax=Liparis tanakae TaxID=230148 RepID=A0A4Z2HIN5_9TELE|nr:hypothetical protein EYF80_024340 [Liparis tanakae]